MAFRRKHNAPPFEVMGLGGLTTRRPAPPPPEPVVVHEPPPRTGDGKISFLERARTPLVLRVPRGYAALLGLLFLALVCLAYGVGFTRGSADAKAKAERARLDEERLLATSGGRLAPTLPRQPTSATPRPAASNAQNPAPGPVLRAVGDDPRQADMNYLVLAEYPRDEAVRLQQFLVTQQLDVVVVSRNNGRFHVVDLRPFAPRAVAGAEYQEHVNRLKQLGRIWKQSHKGPTDLSDLWPQKYKPGR